MEGRGLKLRKAMFRTPPRQASLKPGEMRQREVIADPHAGYYGVELSERTLLPGDGARLGEMRCADWVKHSALGAHA